MCLTFPARVVEVTPDGATVEDRGVVRRASTLLLPEVRPGDWVVVAAGTILRRLDEAEALAIRATLRDAIERTA